jgi:hypothetical protein
VVCSSHRPLQDEACSGRQAALRRLGAALDQEAGGVFEARAPIELALRAGHATVAKRRGRLAVRTCVAHGASYAHHGATVGDVANDPVDDGRAAGALADACGQRLSLVIERACIEEIAFRANRGEPSA